MTMDWQTAQGFVNEILYGIDGAPDIRDEGIVSRTVDSMINGRYFPGSVAEYAAAIDATLRDGHLAPAVLGNSRRYSEAELLDLLRRLDRELDRRRPWPDPPFVKLDVAQWPSFDSARPIARIDRPAHQVTNLLDRNFDQVPVGGGQLPVLLLRLRTGDVIALVGSVDPRSTSFLLLQRDPGDPTEIVTRFGELTGIHPVSIEG
jgi:hypothetical protein